MSLKPVRAEVLSAKLIPNVDRALAEQLGLTPHERALGVVTATIDDCLFTALDEATKTAAVRVVYSRSFYAGSSYPSGPLSGEAIGVLAAEDPSSIQSGLETILEALQGDVCFYAADEEDKHVFYPHVISRTGSFLSKEAKIPEGSPLAYLIAPPVEAVFALDAALKAAAVRLCVFYGPPTETNFAGGLLTGDQAACHAAAQAFTEAVLAVAGRPFDVGEIIKHLPMPSPFINSTQTAGRFVFLDSKQITDLKPTQFTHLHGNVLVSKTHPRIHLRGELEFLGAQILETQVVASKEGQPAFVESLQELLDTVRKIVRAEVLEESLPSVTIMGKSLDEFRLLSHDPEKHFGLRFLVPSPADGALMAKLEVLRTTVRRTERVATSAFCDSSGKVVDREDILTALNRLSSVVYVMQCKLKSGR